MPLSFVLLMAAVISWSTIQAADAPPGQTAVRKQAFTNLKPAEFDKVRRTGTNVVVLDVRTKEEYAQGHIPGSIMIDFMSDEFADEIARLDTGKTYLVLCGTGGRSARACRKMSQSRFTNLFNLEGGMAAWEKAGKPVRK